MMDGVLAMTARGRKWTDFPALFEVTQRPLLRYAGVCAVALRNASQEGGMPPIFIAMPFG